MAMTPAATVGAQIAAALAASTGTPVNPAATASWTQIVSILQTMISAGTVTVTGTANGVTAGAAAAPVTGTGTLA